MENKLSSDNPVYLENEDKFQRYPFAKRIASSIINDSSSECLTYGIYGQWGEGKSSIINFIQLELNNKNVINLKFNPWRFSDERTLIIPFFSELTKIYDKDLKSEKEKLGDLLKDYGTLLSPIPGASDFAKTVGQILGNDSLDSFKYKVEKLLKDRGKKIVIFIDDIDRLDKSEIYSILKLVKLTGDFPNLIYILAFDEKMVAMALSERFGSDNRSGSDFLEKIIQVPLHIPGAQPEMISNFCFEQIDKALKMCKVSLDEYDIQRFRIAFSDLLSSITTPRIAVRYANAIGFTLPMIYREVNTVDLLLIEAIKIFFPEHFELIRSKPHYFLEDNKKIFINNGPVDRINIIKKEIRELQAKYSDEQISGLERVLIELFPYLNKVFNDVTFDNREILETELTDQKRISSKGYFKRYFSYTVLIGEISDLEFDGFIESFDNLSDEQVFEILNYYLNISSETLLLEKIGYTFRRLNWRSIKKLVLNLTQLKFTENVIKFNMFTLASNEYTNASILIYKILQENLTEEGLFDFTKLLMYNPPFIFSMEINYWLRSGKTLNEKIFKTIKDYNELARILIDRVRVELIDIPIFQKYPQYTSFLFNAWKEINREEFTLYVQSKLDNNNYAVVELLKAFTPRLTSTINPNHYLGDFKREQFDNITNLIDKQYLFEKIKEYDSHIVDSYSDLFWTHMNDGQTDINLIKQYLYWYYDNPSTYENE